MEVILLAIAGGFLAVILIIVMQARSNAKIKKQAKEIGANDAIECAHVEGLGVEEKTNCLIMSFDDRIEIEVKGSGPRFNIPMNRLRAAEVKSEQEFKDLDRSVIGRAIVGNLLVPGLGGIVGGMSGLKNKKKKGTKSYYFIINYEDKQGQLTGVTFQDDLNFIRLESFAKGINETFRNHSDGQTIEL